MAEGFTPSPPRGRIPQLRGPARIAKEGDPDGPLFGEVVVFTGALTINRRQATDLAAQSGCRVETAVTRATTVPAPPSADQATVVIPASVQPPGAEAAVIASPALSQESGRRHLVIVHRSTQHHE